ncbi:MAG: HDIG domain-containing protein [Prevotella sp.]|nr:HDIG domain-containing protein [Prevotella sp.]MBR4369298.1 HDIG domain-containing protein [Prevotella sp.]
MSKYKLSESNYLRDITTRIVLVLLTVVIVVWALPREEGKMFHYDEGKPWMYGQLIAQYDFPVYKTEEALQAERDSILKHFQPYYNKNAYIGEKNIDQFNKDFPNGLPDLPLVYKALVANRLKMLYEVGIMDPVQYSAMSKDTSSVIRIVDGKEAQSYHVQQFRSTTTAYEQLFQDEVLVKERAALQRCNLNNYIEPNLIYDQVRSETEKNDMLSLIATASGMVLEGQRIIDRGDIVDSYTYRVLDSFEKEAKKRNASEDELMMTVIGQALLVLILVILFTVYLTLFRKDYFEKPRSIAMLYAMIVIFPVLVSLMMRHLFFNVYIIPYAIVPIFIRVFMDSRTAFITHVIMILLSAVAVKYQYEFIIIQLVAGLVAIYSLRELEKRSQIFLTAVLVTITSSLIYLAIQLIQNDDFSNLDSTMYVYFAVNGFLLLFAYPLMLVIEKTFGFISAVTLFELSNTNNELLRRMSEVASGTFQHSINVGNLGAEIANKIGAKAQLVRTGALYHDIGKMENPVFFTENQAGVNPHDKLSDIESARIIISHVTDGLSLAEKYSLPAVIKEFITTHHGAGLAKYFYVNYKNEHPDEEVDVNMFSYPGPNPFTREQAILMMTDTVEAASRSLPEYTEESISTLVNKLIDAQIADGNFKECPITFRDIDIAKQVLIDRLKSMYHTRIQYPELKS